MKNDASWDIFVSTMWKNQWTRQSSPISDEFKNALYYESQGIADIAVKLYAMAQIRAVGLQTDFIAPKDFSVVASEKLGLVKPALDALRSGDKKRIAAIGDITPISVEDYYAAYSAMLPPEKVTVPEKQNNISLMEKAVLKLLELDVEPAQAKRLTGKVMAGNTNTKSLPGLVRKAFALYISETGNDGETPEDDVPDDIRNNNDYEAMKVAGIIGKAL
jgi:hypothetical protein